MRLLQSDPPPPSRLGPDTQREATVFSVCSSPEMGVAEARTIPLASMRNRKVGSGCRLRAW